MYLCDTICNFLNFSVLDNTSCGEHDVPLYGVKETYSVGVHDVTEDGDLLVLIKDGLGELVILTGYTCCIFRRTVLPFRCGMLGP